jgi:uncharacterized integral membrane protein
MPTLIENLPMNKKNDASDLARQIKSGIVLFLLCLVMIFSLQNSESATLKFLLWEMTLPRALIFFVLFSVGFLCGIGISNWRKITRKDLSK